MTTATMIWSHAYTRCQRRSVAAGESRLASLCQCHVQNTEPCPDRLAEATAAFPAFEAARLKGEEANRIADEQRGHEDVYA